MLKYFQDGGFRRHSARQKPSHFQNVPGLSARYEATFSLDGSKKIGKEYTLSVALLPDIFALVDSGKICAHSE